MSTAAATDSRPMADESVSATNDTAVVSSTQDSSDSLDAHLSALHRYPFDTDEAFLSGLSHIFGHPASPVSEAELAQNSDVVLKAKCFYFNRKHPSSRPIDPVEYQAWLRSLPQSSTAGGDDGVLATGQLSGRVSSNSTLNPGAGSAHPPVTNSSQEHLATQGEGGGQHQQQQQPPYPTSFAAIVDLITNNKPIPGIEEIPTTVLESGSSKQDRAVRRRKPWETQSHATSSEQMEGAGAVQHDATAGPTPATSNGANGSVGDGTVDHHDGPPPNQDEGLLRLLRPDAVPDSGLIAKE